MLLLAINTFSQTSTPHTVKITGTVVDVDTNQPLEYATLVLESIDIPDKITGGVTDSNGKFSVQTEAGNYNIKVEYISYKSYFLNQQSINASKNLGVIKLAIDVAQLDAVEIVGEKTTVQIQLDKKVFNVGKDLTSQGTDALNVLGNVPSVAVDIEGNISLRGGNNVRVLINGRPSNSGISGSDLLRQLPSDAIDRVEVITNPSARYDAEGSSGIINIILKKGEGLGFNGSIQATLGYNPHARTNVNLNYKTTKYNIFSTLGYRYNKAPGGGYNNKTYYTDETYNLVDGYLDQTTDRDRGGNDYNLRVGGEYYFNKRNTLLASFSYNIRDNENMTTNKYESYDENRTLNSSRIREEIELEDRDRKRFNLNYESKFNDEGNHKLTINLNYNNTDEIENSTYSNNYIFGAGNDGNDTSYNIEGRGNFLAQADYTLPFNENEGQIEVGYKSVVNEISSNVEVTRNDVFQNNLSNHLEYEEAIHAFYTQYGNKFGHFTFLAGLRTEISNITITSVTDNTSDTKDYSNLFPTLHLGYELGENQTIQISYSRRIRRPRFWELNPFYNYSDDTNRTSGNPNLNPMYTNAFEVGYLNNWDKFTLSASVYYNHSTDLFQRVTVDTGDVFEIQSYEDVNGDGIIDENDLDDINGDNIIDENDVLTLPILNSQPINTGEEDRYGVELTMSLSPTKWLRLSSDFNIYGFKQDGVYETLVNGVLVNRNIDGENISWFTRFNTQLTLPAKTGVQVRLFYRAPFDNGFNKNKSFLSVNLGVNKDLFDDKATVNLSVSDLFNTRKRRSETFGPTFYDQGEFQWRPRQINLSFTYRFNQKKERQRGGGNGGDDGGGGEG